MTDPQSEQTLEQKVQQLEQLNQEILAMAQGYPQQREDKINNRIQDGEQFNAEIRSDVERANQIVEEVKTKLQNKVWNQDQDVGYLTHGIGEYIGCLKRIDADRLDQLLRNDLQHWRDNLQVAINEAKLKSKTFQKLCEYFQNGLSSQGKKYFKLTRLSKLVNEHASYKINFQWPTDDLMKEMLTNQELSLKKLDIWQHGISQLCSVQATLTNGESSPIFRTASGQHVNQVSLNINTEVKKLSINCSGCYVYNGIKFYDKDNNEISKWEGNHNNWREQQIPEGQKLIGIYGSTQHPYYIMNFGFITVACK